MTDKNDRFKIHVENLRTGHVEKIEESFDPAFLDVDEPELQFRKPVAVNGEAYVAGHELILHLNIRTSYVVPCVICNSPVDVPVSLTNVYESIPLEDVAHGVYNMRDALRQAILLESRPFAECNNGHCPQRKEVESYLKKPVVSSPFDELRSDDFQGPHTIPSKK